MTKYIFGDFHFLQDENKVLIESIEDTKEFDDENEADEYMSENDYNSYCTAIPADGWEYIYIK